MKKLALSLTFIFMASIAFSQENDDYSNTLTKMLEVSGSQELFRSMLGQMTAMYKQQQSNVPEDVWKEIEADLATNSLKELTTMLTPIYKQHLSLEDLKGTIAFYNTPVGKKLAEKTPLISAQSMQVGQQWGMALGAKITSLLKAKGY